MRQDSEASSRLGAGVVQLPVLPLADVPGSWKEQVSRTEALGLLALREADQAAGAPGDGAVGLVWGTTTGGLRETEACLASLGEERSEAELAPLFAFPISGLVSRAHRVLARVDRSRTVCSACSSGALAIAMGAAWVRGGVCDRVYVGGADALCATTLLGFGALGLLDPAGGRPFAGERAGLSLGEGAGCLVLERGEVAVARGASILAWLDGWACGAEAFHVTQPEAGGATPIRLFRAALAQAGKSAEQVGYVNAHGTGTVRNDDAELRALETLFGDRFTKPRVSSNKAQLGHTLGAAGALEAVFSVLALERQTLPPNARLVEPAHPGLLGQHSESAACDAVLSNSFGFGGMDAVLCFAASRSGDREGAFVSRPVFVTQSQVLRPAAGADPRRIPERAELLDAQRSRRFDPMSVLVSACVERCLSGISLDAERLVGVFHGTAFGQVSRAQRFLARARSAGAGRVPPLEFPLLLPSAASGNASIYAGLHGPAAAVSRLVASAHAALHAALDCVSLGDAPRAVSVATEPVDEISQRAGEVLFGTPPAREWCAAGQLVESEPRGEAAIAVLSWGESSGELPPQPARGCRAFLGGNDASVTLDSASWEFVQSESSSVEGLGGLAIERCLEDLRGGERAAGLVVDVVEGRCLYTLFGRVASP
ncbi:MAG: beta-ketoacyl synthase N-terminal-like domain-containing protein [Polyangiaceae bacterium]